VYQSAEIFPSLSVRENLRLGFQSLDQSFNPFSQRKEGSLDSAEQMLDTLDLASKADTKSANLSHGNKKRLEIGMSLATAPDCLLLDEPTSGVSEEDSQRIIEKLVELTQDITVLLIEHDIDIVLEVSDRITALENGQLIAQGTPDEIQNNEKVRRAYLGDYA
jgi:branched-chain amino acid transport system ATP-binding protein